MRGHCEWDTLERRRPLPVSYMLFRSRRVNKALCSAFVVSVKGIQVVRILDPEHKQPYVTLDAIFALAGLTIADGLVRFNLKRSHGDYDLTLAGLEPREGIWSPWNVSLRIAKQLDVFVQLRGLFMEKHAWSLDDGDRILHNWKASPDQLDPAEYSLKSLLNVHLKSITIVSGGHSFNTLISRSQRLEADQKSPCLFYDPQRFSYPPPKMLERTLENKLLRWTVCTHEEFVEERLPKTPRELLLTPSTFGRCLEELLLLSGVDSENLLIIGGDSDMSSDKLLDTPDIPHDCIDFPVRMVLLHHLWYLYFQVHRIDETASSTSANLQLEVSEGDQTLKAKDELVLQNLSILKASSHRLECAMERLQSLSQESRTKILPPGSGWKTYISFTRRDLLLFLFGIILGAILARP